MILIIAEKPSLGHNIASALGATRKGDGCLIGDEYIVTWAFGHLFSLCDVEEYLPTPATDGKAHWTLDNLPCFPETFRFRLRGSEKGKKKRSSKKGAKGGYSDDGIPKQFAVIEQLCRREDVTQIVNAGDADREGEIIVRLILDHALAAGKGKTAVDKPLLRLWLPDQTDKTIRAAAASLVPESTYDNLANEGLARTYVDWLWGVNLTRYATIRTGTLLRVGRVIVPIVRAIYDRDMEIRNFVPRPFLAIVSKEKTHGQVLEMTSKTEFPADDAGRAAAEALCTRYNGCDAVVTFLKKNRVPMPSGKLYSLSVLQSTLGKKYKMPMEKSLAILQKLYEEGYVTYPRTNSEYLATAEKEKIADILENVKNIGYPVTMKDSPKIFDDSKIESHSALTPTYKIPDKTKLSEEEMQVYSTIFRRFAAVFCAKECIAEKTTAEITLFENGVPLETFRLNGTVILEPGWMKYDDGPKKFKTLPPLEEGEKVKINFTPVDRETKPPEHYTIETLNNYLKNPFKDDKTSKKKAMAALGIAEDEETDETRDDTEDYRAVFEGLELGTEATRTGIIDNARQTGYIQLKKDVYTILPDGEFFIESLEKMEITMDKYKTSMLGRALKRVFRGEDTIDDCVRLAEQEITEIFAKKDATTVTKIPYQPKGKGGKRGQKTAAVTASGEKRPAVRAGKCPLCGNDVVRGSYAWGCMGYKTGCAFRVGVTILGREIVPEDMAALLEKGETSLLSGFTSKKGKPFSAHLYLDGGSGEVKFRFAERGEGAGGVREGRYEDAPPPDDAPPETALPEM
ncbi:MAG: topoisomerase C-terminal repeat-containing protein [Clostridia bacterium]|nr:topoisomerase C-terminal repeat-containing protein [Clostridia bacterium]